MNVGDLDADRTVIFAQSTSGRSQRAHLYYRCQHVKRSDDPYEKNPAVLFDDTKICEKCESIHAHLNTRIKLRGYEFEDVVPWEDLFGLRVRNSTV